MFNYLIAMALDLLIGDPYSFPHPIRLLGNFICRADNVIRKLAKRPRELKIWGVALLVTTVALSYLIVFIPLLVLRQLGNAFYIIGTVYFSYTVISTRCLMDEASKVKSALDKDIKTARKQVGYLVSRNTDHLSSEDVVTATVETVAENTTDGVIAPLIYLFIGGPALAMAYKGVSTLDSMVGYKNELYVDLGWASAKADDILNFIPARVAGLTMVLASLVLRYDWKSSFKTLIRDHDKHDSPNSAWTESAAAGALNIQLGGTHVYFGREVSRPTIGKRVKEPEIKDISRMNNLMLWTYFIFVAIVYLTIICIGIL